mmetsp:Transcript_14993/g.28368  ORF Transcript_14993/g.28368 Transcript_14993/m.28368 type:complete len:319 (+) Transcript_14993:115-1071(+)
MKALMLKEFSQDFSGVELMDIKTPRPAKGEVLVRVLASSVNPIDFKGMYGWLQKQYPIPSFPALTGFDVAGVVVAVGEGVERPKLGEAVWASLPTQQGGKPLRMGAYAQFAVLPAAKCGIAPTCLSPAEVASMPVVAITALQALSAIGIKHGDNVLIIGGSGGTGSCAIQVAKALGAHVTTTCSEKNMEFCRSLGADVCINYRDTWQDKLKDMDAVYDCIGESGVCAKSNKVLKDGGKFVSIAAWAEFYQHKWDREIQATMLEMDSTNAETLETLGEMLQDGRIKPTVTQTFKLENIVDALKEAAKGRTVGKIGIEID